MALWNKLTNELIDIIEWLDDTNDVMLYRFYRSDNEIKNGAKLVVREGQAAAFVNEGQLADVFVPGTYTLTTQNLPILSKLKGWKYGFDSPFKAEVYFVSTRVFTDRKWGTQNPIMMRDAEFGPVRLRAFGTFAVRVKYPPVFLRELVGTNSQFTVEEIDGQLRDMVNARFADAVGASKIAVLDLAGNYSKLADGVTTQMQDEFGKFGLELVKLVIENISLPPEVEAAIDKRSSMGVIGNMNTYTQYQTANAITDAAKNPGGIAGVGAGLGAGFAVAQQMGQAMGAGNAGTPPPLPTVAFYAAIDGKQAGPFTLDQLRDSAAQGKLTHQTMVWQQGMDGWKPAGEVPSLSPILASVPPPLPGNG
ncbi:MAG: SPFH domain-containing protein [Tepidisphaeraceae bacterium]|jgi:membrane protease subunit (stomatin/prohibitin family)